MIAEVVSKMTGIPLTRLSTEDSMRLMNMEEELHKRVVSQEQAVAAVAKAVRRSRKRIERSEATDGMLCLRWSDRRRQDFARQSPCRMPVR